MFFVLHSAKTVCLYRERVSMKTKTCTNEQIGIRVSTVTIVLNTGLSFVKLLAGIFGYSAAMISDAIHSLSDVASTFIVILGIKISAKPADDKHCFGHDRFESIASIALAFMLFVTGLGIGYSGVISVMESNENALAIPGRIALIVAVVSIVVKEGMYWYTRFAAKKTGSEALLADAWHHRSDAFSSIGSFIGIFGAMCGFPILDPLASVVICFFILKVAFDIFRSAAKKLVDESCDSELTQKIINGAYTVEGVSRVNDIKTRKFGNGIYAEIEIIIDGNKSLNSSYQIAQKVHNYIENGNEVIRHCTVCMVPKNEN